MHKILDHNLTKRILSVLIAGPLFIFCIIYSQWTYFPLFLIISSAATWEFYHITKVTTNKSMATMGIVSNILLYTFTFVSLCPTINYSFNNSYLLLPPVLISVPLFLLNTENILKSTTLCIFGLWYITLPICCLSKIAFCSGDYSYKPLLALFVLNWSNDSGAFVIGKLIGRHKLAKDISSGKTIEGFIGGIIFCLAAGYVLFYFDYLNTSRWMYISIIIGIIGVIGDLLASAYKRSVSVKDYGNVIPGHGGFIDRFDSIILTSPIMLFLLMEG